MIFKDCTIIRNSFIYFGPTTHNALGNKDEQELYGVRILFNGKWVQVI